MLEKGWVCSSCKKEFFEDKPVFYTVDLSEKLCENCFNNKFHNKR